MLAVRPLRCFSSCPNRRRPRSCGPPPRARQWPPMSLCYHGAAGADGAAGTDHSAATPGHHDDPADHGGAAAARPRNHATAVDAGTDGAARDDQSTGDTSAAGDDHTATAEHLGPRDLLTANGQGSGLERNEVTPPRHPISRSRGPTRPARRAPSPEPVATAAPSPERNRGRTAVGNHRDHANGPDRRANPRPSCANLDPHASRPHANRGPERVADMGSRYRRGQVRHSCPARQSSAHRLSRHRPRSSSHSP